MEEPEFKEMISAIFLKENPLSFAFNKHATHVLIKFIEITNEDPYLLQIYSIICDNFTELSCDSNGLPLIKKCLAWIRNPVLKEKMRRDMIKNAVKLCQNPYGNYALQVAFDVSSLDLITFRIGPLRKAERSFRSSNQICKNSRSRSSHPTSSRRSSIFKTQ